MKMDRTKFLDWMTGAYAQAYLSSMAMGLANMRQHVHASPAHVFRFFVHHAEFEALIEETIAHVKAMSDGSFSMLVNKVAELEPFSWESQWAKTLGHLMPVKVPEYTDVPPAPATSRLDPAVVEELLQEFPEGERAELREFVQNMVREAQGARAAAAARAFDTVQAAQLTAPENITEPDDD